MGAAAKASYFARSAVRGIWHAPFVHAVAVLTLSIALFASGLSRGAVDAVEGLLSTLSDEVELTAYLDPASTPDEREKLVALLYERSGGQVKLVSSDEALRRLSTELADLGQAVADLPENPLPPSVEVKLTGGAQSPLALKNLAELARAQPGVQAVDYGAEAVARLSTLSRLLRAGSFLLFLVVAVASVVIISATLQLAIYARRDEIEVQKLVGATEAFVKVPFLLEGLLQGALGAQVAFLGLWACAQFVAPAVGELFAFLPVNALAAGLLSTESYAQLCAAGCGLGLLGSFVAVGRFSRG